METAGGVRGFNALVIAVALATVGCGPMSRAAAPPTPPASPPARAAPADPLAPASVLVDVRWLAADARAGRGSRSPAARAVATWLEQQLRAAGLEVVRQDVEEVPGQRNVIAIYRPPGAGAAAPADLPRAVLVIAHYDHLGTEHGAIFHGADDNASGVAVVLGVARDLAARRDLRRPVVFLFSAAEELGLDGSRAYAAHPAWPLARTRVAINLDMVGRRFFELAVDRDAAIGAVGLGDDPRLEAAAHRAALAAGIHLVEASPAVLSAIGQAFRDDDWSLRSATLPAVHFSTGLHDDYHRPSDTADKLSPAQLGRVSHLVAGLLRQLD